jgi:hypothetical protein
MIGMQLAEKYKENVKLIQAKPHVLLVYFSGSCIPINPKTFLLLPLAQAVQDY